MSFWILLIIIPNASVIPNLFRDLKINAGMLKQVQHDNVGIATPSARNDSLESAARITTVIARTPI